MLRVIKCELIQYFLKQTRIEDFKFSNKRKHNYDLKFLIPKEISSQG